jgi:chromosome segregation ATPase
MEQAFAKPTIIQPDINIVDKLQGGPTSEGKSKIDVPLSIYSNVNGKTYSAKYFETAEDTAPIEEYVSTQISKRGLKDTTASYEQIIQEIFDKIGVEVNQESTVKYQKVLKFISMIGRNKSKSDKTKDLIKRAKDFEKSKEERSKKILETKYRKVKEENEQKELEKQQYQSKIKNIEKGYKDAINQNQEQQLKIKTLMDKLQLRSEEINRLKEERTQTENDFKSESYKNQVYQAEVQASKREIANIVFEKSKLENELNNVKSREESLILKYKKIKSLID